MDNNPAIIIVNKNEAIEVFSEGNSKNLEIVE